MNTISLDAAVAITGMSHSTLRRRVSDGTLEKFGQDARRRILLALDEVLQWVPVPLGEEDIAILLRADAGEPTAQADMGALFYVAGEQEAALYWLQEAAAQNDTEAMYWLALAHAQAGRKEADKRQATSDKRQATSDKRQATSDNFAIMWLAKAAALGHPVAQAQLERLLQGTAGSTRA